MPILRNLMENLVRRQAEEMLVREGACSCQRCVMDVSALALNNLPVKYVVTSRGESYAKTDFLEMQKTINVMNEVLQAIAIVKRNPRHER